MSDLILSSALLLHHTPWLSIVTVSHFKQWHKLHHPKVLGPLSDDACEALCLLQIHLVKEQRQQLYSVSSFGFKGHLTADVSPHLDPLWAVVACRRPGVRLSLLIQSGILRVPREGIDAPRAESAGGWKLPIWDEARLHSQRLWATCRVWINCEWKVEGGKDGGRETKATERERGKEKNTPKGIKFIHLKKNRNIQKKNNDFYTHEWPRGRNRKRCTG